MDLNYKKCDCTRADVINGELRCMDCGTVYTDKEWFHGCGLKGGPNEQIKPASIKAEQRDGSRKSFGLDDR